jgi:hypothetical protein
VYRQHALHSNYHLSHTEQSFVFFLYYALSNHDERTVVERINVYGTLRTTLKLFFNFCPYNNDDCILRGLITVEISEHCESVNISCGSGSAVS